MPDVFEAHMHGPQTWENFQAAAIRAEKMLAGAGMALSEFCAFRDGIPLNKAAFEGLAVLNAAEKPEVLVALLKCGQAGGLTLFEMDESDQWHASCDESVICYGETVETAILALAEVLEKGGGGDA